MRISQPEKNPSLNRTLLWLMVGLTILAALLRVHRLDTVPLRGDEAFTVLTWAQPPEVVWNDLAEWEPHPIGTFVLFWGWKGLAGESEFAMRALPMLLNLIGVALMMALARRLLHHKTAIILLGLLWVVNPFEIWHAQDVRNYAIWAVLSPLAMWLFLRALEDNQSRDWLLYAAAQTAACYLFLLEPFFILVQLIFLLLFYRRAEIIRSVMITWIGIGIALIPLFIQLYRLADSGYSGTATPVSLELLIREFIPTFLFGETRLTLLTGGGLVIILFVRLVTGKHLDLNTRVLLLLWLFLPLLLLSIAGTRLNIFRPRYLIPVTTPLLLALMFSLYNRQTLKRRYPPLPLYVSAVLVLMMLASTYSYFYTDPPKAPDWRSFADYLEPRASSDDVIVIANVDPAFSYYYRGPAVEIPFQELRGYETLLDHYNGVFLQHGIGDIDIGQYFQDETQLIPPMPAIAKYYRSYEVDPVEIEVPLDLTFGDVAKLRGYSLLGGDELGITVLLYWEPLRQTEKEFVGFIHAFDAPNSDFPLRGQDDHRPLQGFASTRAWETGDLLRDPYAITLPPGTYRLDIGMYEEGTLAHLLIYDSGGNTIGETYPLTGITIP